MYIYLLCVCPWVAKLYGFIYYFYSIFFHFKILQTISWERIYRWRRLRDRPNTCNSLVNTYHVIWISMHGNMGRCPSLGAWLSTMRFLSSAIHPSFKLQLGSFWHNYLKCIYVITVVLSAVKYKLSTVSNIV